ncbi:MAG: hypothetical protein MJ194_07430 [Clostridia bacterium]|nr:hypothetical protein [Clostridia bacterium]
MISKITVGLAAGLLTYPAAKALAAKLLHVRGKELKKKKTESLLFLAASAVCGAVTVVAAGFIPESIYLLAPIISCCSNRKHKRLPLHTAGLLSIMYED